MALVQVRIHNSKHYFGQQIILTAKSENKPVAMPESANRQLKSIITIITTPEYDPSKLTVINILCVEQ